tara:strand:+ start:222 stop:443 length:222 start_codon:yes stop_codon:yes gene_type:complete
MAMFNIFACTEEWHIEKPEQKLKNSEKTEKKKITSHLSGKSGPPAQVSGSRSRPKFHLSGYASDKHISGVKND